MKNSKVYLEPRVLDVDDMIKDGFRVEAWCTCRENGYRRHWTVDLSEYAAETKHTEIAVDCDVCGRKNVDTILSYCGKHSGGSGLQR